MMTKEAMDAVTLAEFEAMAERFSGAVRLIREAQEQLGLAPGAAPQAQSIFTQGAGARAPSVAPTANQFTPAEQAERARLIKLNFEAGLPEDIKGAMVAEKAQ